MSLGLVQLGFFYFLLCQFAKLGFSKTSHFTESFKFVGIKLLIISHYLFNVFGICNDLHFISDFGDLSFSFLDYIAKGFQRATFDFPGFLIFAFIFSISFVHSLMTLLSCLLWVYFVVFSWSSEWHLTSWISFQPLFLIYALEVLIISHLWLHPTSVIGHIFIIAQFKIYPDLIECILWLTACLEVYCLISQHLDNSNVF